MRELDLRTAALVLIDLQNGKARGFTPGPRSKAEPLKSCLFFVSEHRSESLPRVTDP